MVARIARNEMNPGGILEMHFVLEIRFQRLKSSAGCLKIRINTFSHLLTLHSKILSTPRHPEHRTALPVPLGFDAKDLNYDGSTPLGALTVHHAFFIHLQPMAGDFIVKRLHPSNARTSSCIARLH